MRSDSVYEKILDNFRNYEDPIECTELIQTMVDCIIQNMSMASDTNEILVQFTFQVCKNILSRFVVEPTKVSIYIVAHE